MRAALRLRTLGVAAISLCAFPLTPAFAIQVTLSFTVNDFGIVGTAPSGVPTDPVTGSFTYDAPSITSDPTSFTAVNLTIGGHAYTLAEVGSNTDVIGAVVNGVNDVFAGSDDFILVWHPASAAPEAFVYATLSDTSAVFESSNFTQFNVTAVPVIPEPSTWAMMALGFGLLGLVGYRKTRSDNALA
jgi:hypothetical protein